MPLTSEQQQAFEIPYGYCQCGCGQKTTISNYNDKRRNIKKGEPNKFLKNHHVSLRPNAMKGKIGKESSQWKGGEHKTYDGYMIIWNPIHPCADIRGYIKRARLVMEKHLETILPKTSVFHHNNHIRTDDRPENITIFKSQSEHAKFHQDENAFLACGNKHFRKCWICKKYDDPANMVKHGRGYQHRECYNRYRYQYRKKKNI